jgi:hypothetical protein
MDLWQNMNATSRALPVITYFESGSFQIDKYQDKTIDKSCLNGHCYTDKAPLPTYVVIPFFGLLKSMGIIKAENGSLFGMPVYILGDILCGTLPFVMAIVLVFYFALKSRFTNVSVYLCMLPFYASFMFVFSSTFFNHLFSGILLLFGYLQVKNKNFLLAGIFAGLSFLSEYTIALIFPIWVLQMWMNEKKIKPSVYFSLGTLPAFAFILFYNYTFTGHPFEMLYKHVSNDFEQMKTNYGFNLPQLKAVWGLTFSQYKGVFFYSPFLVLGLYYFIKKNNQKIKTLLGNYLILPSVAYVLFVSSYFMWWGGWTYGPRHLTAIAMLLTFEGILFLSEKGYSKLFFWFTISFGFIPAFMAKTTALYSIPSEIEWPLFQTIFPEFFRMNINPNNLLTIFFKVTPFFAIWVWLFLFVSITYMLQRWFKSIYLKTN